MTSTNLSPPEPMKETEEERKRLEKEAYEEEERLIEENRQAPVAASSREIRWAYRSKINDTVYCMNGEGSSLPEYEGKFADHGARILEAAPPEAEFYVSFSGAMEFVKVSREQWIS